MKDAIGLKQTSESRVQYVDEYLVPFNALEQYAAEYGLHLVKKVNFHEYFDKHITNPPEEMPPRAREMYRSLFERMV